MSETSSVLVVGGGIAGIQAALNLAEAGFKVHLVDRAPSIGGLMARLDKIFPTGDCSVCALIPNLTAIGVHPNIELITNAEVEKVRGEAGNFEVVVRKRARYVDEEKCTGCGLCAEKCPVRVVDWFNGGLSERTAIYLEYPQAMPPVYVIDPEACTKCGACVEVCRVGAINLEQEDEELTLKVGAIILALGFEEADPKVRREYGFGLYPNVVTTLQFERLSSVSGPSGGVIVRPSDRKPPRRIAFVQCVGSRDPSRGSPYCSSICCMYAIKEAMAAKEKDPNVECTIFFMDIRAHGKGFEAFYNRAKEYGIRFVRSRVSHISEVQETRNLIVHYVEDEEPKQEEFDLVVLSVGVQPPKDVKKLAEKLGIELNEYGFCRTGIFTPLETSRPGIYVCGGFTTPIDIAESVTQASGVVAKVMELLQPAERASRGEPPASQGMDVKEPRIGVFICRCGINIGGVLDVPSLIKYARELPNVVHVEEAVYACSESFLEQIRDRVRTLNLNRVVVAACTPRVIEPLFQEAISAAGLNPYLLEIANIRDQCSWVHMNEPEEATEKAKDLVRAAVAKARLLEPVERPVVKVVPAGLVVGGGLSGMVAALELARRGFEVHLVEREGELGGNLRHIHYVLGPENPQERLRELVREVTQNERIHVHLNTEVVSIDGHVGNFRTILRCGGEEREVRHGVVILATGGVEYKPTEYLYGVDRRVLTQRELEERLARGEFNARSVVMIQCVGSRNEQRPSCSRICCIQAVKNALKIKEVSPETDVYILYKDIRTYGFYEAYYRRASEMGVLFMRYDDEHKPKVSVEDGRLKVMAWEPVMKGWVPIEPDLLVLSVAVTPDPDAPRIAEMLGIPLTEDGFFLEAQMKLRPFEAPAEGVFICGLAHSPKLIEESIAQACAAAAQAATLLSKGTLEVEELVAYVDENLCSGCRICESVCDYGAIRMVEEDGKLRARVVEALCKGCGVCVSACPAGAISIPRFTDKQILAQVQALLA